ncbi:hypothetical protein [Parashewanella tropica]|uniref:hypothetical protein n=1 Tax=Parashewanella tropica TaxID=2547970 RepID=UPI0010596707|nr:hypothetical protein [Parashewanella tropica]
MSCLTGVSVCSPIPFGYATGEEYEKEFLEIGKLKDVYTRITQYRRLLADEGFGKKNTYEMHGNTRWNLALEHIELAEKAEADNKGRALELYGEAKRWFQESLMDYQNIVKGAPKSHRSERKRLGEISRDFVEQAKKEIRSLEKKIKKLESQQEQLHLPKMEYVEQVPCVEVELRVKAVVPISRLRSRMQLTFVPIDAEPKAKHDALCDRIEAIAKLPSYSEKRLAFDQLPVKAEATEEETSDLATSYWNLGLNIELSCNDRFGALVLESLKQKRKGKLADKKKALIDIARHYQLAVSALIKAQHLYTDTSDKNTCRNWERHCENKVQELMQLLQSDVLEEIAKSIEEEIEQALLESIDSSIQKEELPSPSLDSGQCASSTAPYPIAIYRSDPYDRYSDEDVKLTYSSPLPLSFSDEVPDKKRAQKRFYDDLEQQVYQDLPDEAKWGFPSTMNARKLRKEMIDEFRQIKHLYGQSPHSNKLQRVKALMEKKGELKFLNALADDAKEKPRSPKSSHADRAKPLMQSKVRRHTVS